MPLKTQGKQNLYDIVKVNVHITHNKRPKEERQGLVEFEQVQKKHEESHQELQACGGTVLKMESCSETHESHEESHLNRNRNENVTFASE